MLAAYDKFTNWKNMLQHKHTHHTKKDKQGRLEEEKKQKINKNYIQMKNWEKYKKNEWAMSPKGDTFPILHSATDNIAAERPSSAHDKHVKCR